MKRSVLFLMSVLMLPAPVLAQSLQLPSDPGYVGIQFQKTSFDDIVDASSYTLYLTARQRFTPSLSAEIGVPYTRGSYPGGSSSTLGNLFLGLEARNTEAHTSLDLGIWAPTASEDKVDALLIALASDLNRWESFLPNTFSAVAGVNYGYVSRERTGFRLRAAPTILVPTEGDAETESFLLYSGHVGYFGEKAEISGGVMGRMILTEDVGGFGERASHQVEIEAALKHQSARVGMVLLVPIDDNDLVDFVFGFQGGMAIPGAQ